MEFYVDKDYKVIKFLEHWMEFMNSGSFNPQNQHQTLEDFRKQSKLLCENAISRYL